VRRPPSPQLVHVFFEVADFKSQAYPINSKSCDIFVLNIHLFLVTIMDGFINNHSSNSDGGNGYGGYNGNGYGGYNGNGYGGYKGNNSNNTNNGNNNTSFNPGGSFKNLVLYCRTQVYLRHYMLKIMI
jgi:hypothetical protein